MVYRPEIDGLRALAVMLVIAFHAGFAACSGGYVGVDIFFVISGFLITGIITDELDQQAFSLAGFYQRRATRLLPALIITLLATWLVGFVCYDEANFDRLGKEIAFAAVGSANLLFAQGDSYFAQEIWSSPLIHLWSLGVEEQFYLFWPTIVLLCHRRGRHALAWCMAVLCLGSLAWAEYMVHRAPIGAYFYPQYRVFELLIGACGAEALRRRPQVLDLPRWLREGSTAGGLGGIAGALLLLDQGSAFPGLNALLPCAGTLLFLVFGQGTRTAALFSVRPVVVLGLISYPLYLFHQPLIALARHRDATTGSMGLLLAVLLIAVPSSYLTYRCCEKPLQRLVRGRVHARRCLWLLGGSLAVVCGLGLVTARSDGLPWRFARFNAFAQAVAERNRPPFSAYPQGIVASSHPHPDALFLGDSVLQQYVPSLITAFGLAPERVDLVTRGGCVLLKGADFTDQYSTIPGDDLRAYLYERDAKTYRYVFISQDWTLYSDRVGNFDPVTSGPAVAKWRSLIEATIRFFRQRGATVVLLGLHPTIAGTDALSPSLLLSEDRYRSLLPALSIANLADMAAARRFFEQWHHPPETIILHPGDLWLDPEGRPLLQDGQWSFFFDRRHIGSGSVDRVTERLRRIIPQRSTPPAGP